VQDLRALHPEFADSISKKLLAEVSAQSAAGKPVPYRTRLGLSMFMGQPLDSTMTPQSIMAALPKPSQPMQQAPAKKSKGSPSKMSSKSSNLYKTADQGAESDRSDRD
jgi:hypothetical protein